MEGAAVKFALGKLNVLLNMGLEMYSVSNEVIQMELELRMINGFLEDANSKRNRNPLVKQWVNEVRDVAYRIEDAIDTFLVDVEGNRPRSFGVWSKLVRPAKKPFKVKKLVDEVKAIRQTLRTISQLRTDLGITADSSGSSPQNDQELFRTARPDDVDDSEVVGLDPDKHQIIRQLLDRNISRRTILSIVGIGGLGKTTLAQKVYNSDELKEPFDCRIWRSISQRYNVKDLLREILYSVEPAMRHKEPAIRDDDLSSELKRSLTQKRYFIVLDDVWEIDLWESLRTSLPDRNNASRVLITTRKLEVAYAADGGLRPYELRYLNDNESLSLLLKKAIPIRDPEAQHHLTDLNEVAKQLTKKCGGLPLALIVLGSILSTRERTYNAWQRVNETLDWHDTTAKRCSEVLLLSYVDLPYHLKPCFLYFASFPEDHRISAKYVIKMWIAEGFIPRDGRGKMEERAQNFLEELIQRSLVRVIKRSWNGNCKICRMHDLVRDMAIHEAKEENFFTVFTKADDGIQLAAQKVRRAMLQASPPTNFGFLSPNLRSVLFLGPHKLNNLGFRLIKVLSIEKVDIGHNNIFHKSWLEGLIHLRYLGFRYCVVRYEFLSISFSYLKNLETVDFQGTTYNMTSFNRSTEICNKLDYLWQGNCRNNLHTLWKVPSLRHVTTGNLFETVPLPSKSDHLKNMQTLKLGLNSSRRTVKGGWQNLKALLKRTEHLVSLAITSSYFECVPFLSEGTRDLSCHKTIQSLSLKGKWARDLCVLNHEMFPTNLTKLTLKTTMLEDDPMPILERLQFLRILLLLVESYVGTSLTCTKRGFPSLQKLELKDLPWVSHWDIKEGAMPKLTHLRIIGLNVLRVLPELQKVPTLHNLELDELLYEIAGNQRIITESNITLLCVKRW